MKSDLPNNPITDIKILPELEIEGSDNSISILIRHDFYSSDNDHGKRLLNDLLLSLQTCGKDIDRIMFIDSGVKLLSSDSLIDHDCLISLINKAQNSCICSDSLDHYGIDSSMLPQKLITVTSEEIFSSLLFSHNTITI